MSLERTPVAKVSGPLTGGRGWPFGAPLQIPDGFVIEELLLDGVAVSYQPVAGVEIGLDGRWVTQEGGLARYRTRMYVVRPRDPDRFNGVVVVNWQNVTNGDDVGTPAAADLDDGFAWVGVTTQRAAIDGQQVPGGILPASQGMPAWDPERYGTLSHPGDEYSYDIFTQAGRALAADRPRHGHDPLGGLEPRLLVAAGVSQSAMRLGSYLNIAHQREHVFDGFLLTLHWGTCPYPPDQPLMTSLRPIVGGLFGSSSAIRDDGEVAVLVLCSESEVLHNYPVRQPDSDTFRFWEMAGASHVSVEIREELDAIYDRDGIAQAVATVADHNTVQWDYVRDAALRQLVKWIDSGRPPPSIPPIEVDPGPPAAIRCDEQGNALGGIRLPEVAAPNATNTGTNDSNPMAALAGSTRPFSPEQLRELYGVLDTYLRAWDTAVDDLVELDLIPPRSRAAVRARGRSLVADRFDQ